MRYLALLRGVNVGGKGMLSMTDLRAYLEKNGFQQVSTYINSGNVIFESAASDASKLAATIRELIQRQFKLDVGVAVFSQPRYAKIIAAAPGWWGKDPDWKHNFIVLLEPYDIDEIVTTIGTLKPDIEALQTGDGVLYQSVSWKFFGRSTTGKLASSPAYKQMTIRNYNTAQKLLTLLNA